MKDKTIEIIEKLMLPGCILFVILTIVSIMVGHFVQYQDFNFMISCALVLIMFIFVMWALNMENDEECTNCFSKMICYDGKIVCPKCEL